VRREQPVTNIQTGDADKDQIQAQWNRSPAGSHYVREAQPHTLEWFLEVERHRYFTYAPWMPRVMEFSEHRGQDVLEIGGGLGTDLAQFAAHGAAVTDLDLSAGHLCLAQENFQRRGLPGRFIHHDAESLPFEDESFDVVYSNGVLHHTPNTTAVIDEISRVLRPGGRAIVMVYAENSLHFWRQLVWQLGIKQGLLEQVSIGEIMSRSVERSANEARPLVKVYSTRRLRALFDGFTEVDVVQRQLVAEELPRGLQWTRPLSERFVGWNLIAKATKPHTNRQARLRPEDSSRRVRH
jgi:ubiquinone/menaquinone biosynthesis C-methylase UbiE